MAMLRRMMFIRAFETALAARAAYGFRLPSSGEEAATVGVCAALSPEDLLLTDGRSIGPALARGVDPGRLMAELRGGRSGVDQEGARAGDPGDRASGSPGAHAVVSGDISVAADMALQRRAAGQHGVVAIMFGECPGKADALRESLNIAARERLPLLFACKDNGSPVPIRTAPPLGGLARLVGVPVMDADGLDPLAVATAARTLLKGVREGEGPAFLRLTPACLDSHSAMTPGILTTAQRVALGERCPIQRLACELRSLGLLSAEQQAVLEAEASGRAAAALALAEG